MSQVPIIGFLGLVAVAASWSLAVVLFRVGSRGTMARKLSLLLVIEGITLLTAGFPQFAAQLFGMGIEFWDGFYGRHPWAWLFEFFAHHGGDAAMIALYPPFLAAALQTRLTRPFARRRIKILVAVAAIGLVLISAASSFIWNSSLGNMLLYATVVVVFAFGLVASLQAWRAAEPGIARDRARVFAIAFGIRDICWVMSYAVAFWVQWNNPSPQEMVASGQLAMMKVPYALGTLFAVPLIAYGILQAHLFDIDLRIRWTIKQSTLAGIFVAVFYLISEGAAELLSAELGNVVGLLAAAVLMFFLAPLQRFSERVASAAMPNTVNTPEYTVFRKMQVYESALAEALQEAGISQRERALLTHLRDSLGISDSDAEAIEQELLRKAGGDDEDRAGN